MGSYHPPELFKAVLLASPELVGRSSAATSRPRCENKGRFSWWLFWNERDKRRGGGEKGFLLVVWVLPEEATMVAAGQAAKRWEHKYKLKKVSKERWRTNEGSSNAINGGQLRRVQSSY
ncbi:hypothetical protein H5410_001916 [Solanum commersonii]|uniref:Uncharacterized protein n=1 Tax=Solanum commersonii TaxID=4109 RepID=A0A9J6B1G0_SOLCO|nr:hypothetical protein H5410_001916 [Solanum commersonii]